MIGGIGREIARDPSASHPRVVFDVAGLEAGSRAQPPRVTASRIAHTRQQVNLTGATGTIEGRSVAFAIQKPKKPRSV